jgi:Transposase DDE domain
MPVRAIITTDTRADCAEAENLIDGFQMDYLLGDKGYDSDAIVAKVEAQGAKAVIPPRKTASNPENTTRLSTSCSIWWRTPSRISSGGGRSPRAMQRTCRPS